MWQESRTLKDLSRKVAISGMNLEQLKVNYVDNTLSVCTGKNGKSSWSLGGKGYREKYLILGNSKYPNSLIMQPRLGSVLNISLIHSFVHLLVTGKTVTTA